MERKPHWKAVAVLWLLLITPVTAFAHVKWFTDFSFADAPRPLSETLSPTFFALATLSVGAVALAVFIDRFLSSRAFYERIIAWFEERKVHAPLVLRVGMGATLLLSWQANTLLAPDLAVAESWIGWAQFAVAGLLLFPVTSPLAGAGVLALYALAIAQFGVFYMLDYFVFVGVGVYLLVHRAAQPRLRGLRTPALFFSLGFSLAWLALEKLVYPQWGLYILAENPQLLLGLDPEFFLKATAFVEFSLGYLLIIGLLERPLALVVTMVFFTTTLVFGKVEVIGHTILHAALIVFLLEGPGEVYRAPITFHRRLPLRVAFAVVNFVLLLAIMLVPYQAIAEVQHSERTPVVSQR